MQQNASTTARAYQQEQQRLSASVLKDSSVVPVNQVYKIIINNNFDYNR